MVFLVVDQYYIGSLRGTWTSPYLVGLLQKILSNGLNERFSGGLFGHGSYLVEDGVDGVDGVGGVGGVGGVDGVDGVDGALPVPLHLQPFKFNSF